MKTHTIGNSTSILADCNEYMRMCTPKQFDLLISDPPYFNGPEKGRFYGSQTSKIGVKRYEYPVCPEEWEVPTKEYFDLAFEISKHQIIWGCNYYDYKFTPGRIIWDKVNTASSFSDCEQAFCSMYHKTKLFRYMWSGMLQGQSIYNGHIMQGNKRLNEKRIHPTQKPVSLYLWTLMEHAIPGWRIIDTHQGSGSLRIACYLFGVDYVGIEKAEPYFNDSNDRFEKFINQEAKNYKLWV